MSIEHMYGSQCSVVLSSRLAEGARQAALVGIFQGLQGSVESVTEDESIAGNDADFEDANVVLGRKRAQSLAIPRRHDDARRCFAE